MAPPLEPWLHAARTAAEHAALLQHPAVVQHWTAEQELLHRFGWTGRQRLAGWCSACGRAATFVAKRRHLATAAGLGSDGYRNSLRCTRCGLASRQRLVADLLRRLASPRARIWATEHATAFGAWLRKRRRETWAVTTSEFLGPGHRGGTLHRGIRHEDAMAPSFAAASFDVVVSCDVLEHVPDHRRALAAAARVLAPDGVLLLTVPFAHLQATTVVRAEPTADGVRHLLPPVRHHDPLRREGVLVFHDFGWDLLDDARAAGFASATVLLAGSLAHGYLGHPLHAFVFGKGAAGWPPGQRDHDAAPACR